MIYIIDDKKSRQRDYGWDEDRLSTYNHIVKPIWGVEAFNDFQNQIIKEGNIILFHESFPQSKDFNETLDDNSTTLYVAKFSGSKGSRFVDGRRCMLAPDVLYGNLEVFIKKYQEGELDFRYLAFGENYEIEEQLRNRLNDVNAQNTTGKRVSCERRLFFAATSDDIEVEPPFDITPTKDWDLDFTDRDITDIDLDGLVSKWFFQEKYDVIYIPLCFGGVLSDFMGLRLAMHIRFTSNRNDSTPIFIYGEARIEELTYHYCFDVLKLPNTYLIDCSNHSFLESLNKKFDTSSLNVFNTLDLKIPSNLGDNHNVANRWAIFRWIDMIRWNDNVPTIVDDVFLKSLYFKYLVSRFGKHDRFKKNDQKCSPLIKGINGKSIVYIDDEYEYGWGWILKSILADCSGAYFHPFSQFDKELSRDALIKSIKLYVDEHDADCYIIDLRLHESDFENGSHLTGHEVAEYIKQKNKGNQIVIFTASNKIWNLKRDMFETDLSGELKVGAIDYILKESPDLNLSRFESKQIFNDFYKAIKRACEMSYLKELFNKQDYLKSICPDCSQLDSTINLLCMDNGNNDQDLLKAALLGEIVFIEEYIKTKLNYELFATGKDSSLKVDLCCKTGQRRLTGHIFFRRELIEGHNIVVDVSPYIETETEPMDGWCNISKSDVTLVSAYLLIELNLNVSDVRKYINFKKIRNIQIAHGGGSEIKIKATEIVDFYYSVICPMIEAQKDS